MAKKGTMKVVQRHGRRHLSEHTEELFCALTDKELLMRGAELAKLKDEELAYEGEFETMKAKFKQREKELLERRSLLSDIVRDKKERRSVKVEAVADYDRGVLEEIRTDTNDVINERALRPDELQVAFDLGDQRTDVEEQGL